MILDRQLQKEIVSLAGSFPVISVMGPRQSGKTTLVRATFPGYDYVNLETMHDRLAVEDDPRRFLARYKETGVIIDEAQKVPHLFSYLQGVVDESGKMGKFILTGSQNFLLLEKITQSLAGRVVLFTLMPFNLDELDTAELLPGDIDHMLFTGGYPVLYDRGILPNDYFPSYIQTYIERDVRSITRIGDLSVFQRFVKVIAGRVGQLLNLSSVGNELGINYKTVRSWISILEASFVVFLMSPHVRNYNKRLVKQPKLYFYDTGLLCSLLNIQDVDQLSTHYLRGNIFESFIVSEYYKMLYHRGQRPNAYFWRTNTGHEIDLLIEEAGSFKVTEIKSGQTLHRDFFKPIDYYRTLSGISENEYFLVYGGDKNLDMKETRVISWRALSELL